MSEIKTNPGELDILDSTTGVSTGSAGGELDILDSLTQSKPAFEAPDFSKPKNSFNIVLNSQELQAANDGARDAFLGTVRSDYDQGVLFRKQSKYSGDKQSDGSSNATSDLAEDYVADEVNAISTGKLYKEVLGDTAYADLKKACGLNVDESFTDYYNKTKYIPKGYEIDARLALAEEKKMNIYMDYKNGKVSYDTFLYQAYGTELLKEEGYDFSSSLFWYNRRKNGDYSNPLDSDTFLSDLISNSEALFKADSWYRDSSSKTLSSSLAGLSTGTQLSEEEFKKVFSEQVENLSEYFNNDIDKIMTYYRAGYMGSAFSPFVDVNGDGKYDYYYHNDGKLYAVDNEESVGQGTAKVSLVYNDDGSVHSAQIHEGIDGWADSLWDGFSGFFASIADIGALAVNGISSVFGVSFVDQQAKWESWKKEWLMDEDRVIFDSMSQWNSDDWVNKSAEAVGYIAGMAVLIAATLGMSTGVQALKESITAGKEVATESIKTVSKATASQVAKEIASKQLAEKLLKDSGKEVTEKTLKAAIKKLSKEVIEEAAGKIPSSAIKKATSKMSEATVKEIVTKTVSEITAKGLSKKSETAMINSAMRTLIKDGAEQGITKALLNSAYAGASNMALKSGAQSAISNIASALVGRGITDSSGKVIADSVANTVGKARGGTLLSSVLQLTAKEGTTWAAITSNTWFKAGTNAAELAVRDVMQVMAQLHAQNSTLAYLSENVTDENGNPVYHVLDDSEIFWRCAGIAGTDMVISTLFRGTGDQGFSSRVSVDTSNIQKFLSDTSKESIDKLSLYLSHMRSWSIADSLLDTFENISTAAVQAALSNPYAQTSGEMWQSAVNSMLSPKSVAMNIYATVNNLHSYTIGKGNFAINNTSMYDDKWNALISQVNIDSKTLGNSIEAFDIALSKSSKYSSDIHDTLMNVRNKINTDLSNVNDGTIVDRVIKARQELDDLFSNELLETNKTAVQAAFDLSDDEYTQFKTFLKDYNSTAKRGNKIGVVSGVSLFKASKNNDKHVMEIYKTILNNASVAASQKQQAYDKWMNGLNNPIRSKLFKKKSNLIKQYMNNLGAKVVTDYRDSVQDLEKTFVANRFETISSFTDEDNLKKQEKALLKERKELKEIISSDYFKSGSFSESTMLAGVNYTYEYDSKTGKYKWVAAKDSSGTSFAENNILANLFANAAKNKDAIKALVDANVFSRDAQGNISFDGGAPLFYITIPSNKHNDILKDSKTNPALRNLLNTLDLMAKVFNTEDTNTYKVPLLLKIKVATGTSDNPDATQDVYVIPNNFGAGLTESANKLQSFEGMLYTMYVLKSYSENPDGHLSSETLQRYMAQLGTLAIEEATSDPYYDFLKEYKDGKVKDFNKQIILATKNLLVGSNILTKTNESAPATFDRQHLLELYRAGAISTTALESLQSDPTVGQKSKDLLKYINYAVAEENKIKKALESLTKIQNDTHSSQDTSDVVSFIKDLNSTENKDLLEALKEDNKIPVGLLKLLNAKVEDQEALVNFWQELQSVTQFGALRNLVGGSSQEIESLKDTILDLFLSKTATKGFVEKSNLLSFVVDGLNEHFHTDKSNKFFTRLNQKKLKQFLIDPIAFTQNYIDTYKYKNKDGSTSPISQARLDFCNSLMEEFKSSKNYYKDVLTWSLNATKDTDEAKEIMLDKLASIAIGTSYNPDKLNLSDLTYDKKDLGELIFTSNKTKKIFAESLKPDRKSIAKDIINSSIDYYYKGTSRGKRLNTITLNILDFLPKNLQDATKALLSSKALSATAGISAEIKSEDLEKTFNSLIKGYNSSATAYQYKNYKEVLDLAIATNNFVFVYDMNDSTQMNNLSKFLTSTGYGDSLKHLKEDSESIQGLYFKSVETNNITSVLDLNKFYSYSINKAYSQNKFASSEAAQKDYIPVLYNMYNSLNLKKEDSTLNLFETTTDYVLDTANKAKNRKAKIISVQKQSPLFFDDYITITKGDIVFTQGWYEEMLSRAAKGTLEGGKNLNQYIIKNRNLVIDTDNTSIDEEATAKATRTKTIVNVLDDIWNYLTRETSDGNAGLAFTISVPQDKVEEFKAMYSSPTSLYTIRPQGSDFVITPNDAIFDGSLTKDMILDSISKNGFNLKQLLPIWNPVTSLNMKVTDSPDFAHFSNETLYSIIASKQYRGLSSSDEINTELFTSKYTSNDIFNIGDDALKEYEAFCTSNTNKTYSELLELCKTKSSDNYYMKCLECKLELELAKSKFVSQSLSKEDSLLLDFANEKFYKAIGAELNIAFSNLLEKNHIITDEDINNLRQAIKSKNNLDCSPESLKVLLNALRNNESMLFRDTLEDSFVGVSNPLLAAISKFIVPGDTSNLSVAVEYFADATSAERKAFITLLNEAAKDSEFTEAEQKSLLELANKLLEKEDIIRDLNPKEYQEDYTQNSEKLFEYSGVNSPSVRVLFDKGFLTSNQPTLDNTFIDEILSIGISRKLRKKQGSPYIKLSSSGNISGEDSLEDSFIESLSTILGDTVLRGLNNNPGSVLVENLERRDMIGKLFTSISAHVLDLQDMINASNITLDKTQMKTMLADLAIKAHALTTGTTFQSEYATSMILQFNSRTGKYSITPLGLSISDENKSLFSYFIGRKALGGYSAEFDSKTNKHISKDEFELRDYSLDNIEKIISNNPDEHVFLFKGAKNMFMDSIDGSDSKSIFVCLDSDETRNKFKSAIVRKAFASGEDKVIQSVIDKTLDVNEYLKDYYSLTPGTLPMQDRWFALVNTLKDLGINNTRILSSIYNSVQSLYVGRDVTLNDQWIDDCIEAATNTLQGNTDDFTFHVIMDTLKYGINSTVLDIEDKINLKNYSEELRADMKASYPDKSERLDILHNSIIDVILSNDKTQIDNVKESIKLLTPEEKSYCLKQVMLNKLDGSDLFTILNTINKNNLSDVLTSLGSSQDFKTSWKSNDGAYDIYTVGENTISAIMDNEFLINLEDKNYSKGLYQVAFAIINPNPSESNEEFYSTSKKHINDSDCFNILIKNTVELGAINKDAKSETPNTLRYVESDKSFESKRNLVKDNLTKYDIDSIVDVQSLDSIGKQSNGTHTIIVSTPEEAMLLTEKIFKAYGVKTLLGYNSFGEGVSDYNFFTDEQKKELNLNTLDIRLDVLNKVYSHSTESLPGESMDDVRANKIIKSTRDIYNEATAHDALSDVLDEYDLLCTILSNPTRTNKVYTGDLDSLINLFEGVDLKSVNFKNLALTDNLKSLFTDIDISKSTFKRGNQQFKEVLDLYKGIINANNRKNTLSALRNVANDNYNVFTSQFDLKYNSAVKNKKQKAMVSNILISLMDAYGGSNISKIIREKNYTPDNLSLVKASLFGSLDSSNKAVLKLLHYAQSGYSYERRKSLDVPIQQASRESLIKEFYSLPEEKIIKYLAYGRLKLNNPAKKEFSKDELADSEATIKSFIKPKAETAQIDTVELFNQLKAGDIIDTNKLFEAEAEADFRNQIFNPLSRLLNLGIDDDVSKAYDSIVPDSVLSKAMSDETKKRFLTSMLNVYGTTETNEANIKHAKEQATYNERIKKLVKWSDKYKEKMEDLLFSKEGLFAKNLVQASSLWSMGTGRRSFRHDGEENTLYIGKDLLTSKKAYASLYGKYKEGSEFYVLTWRQPLQQTTPLNVMKVKVVAGQEYSMTESTARTLHNGDFDGDYFYTSMPTENSNLFGENLWKYQNVAGGLFNNLFEDNSKLVTSNNFSNDQVALIKETFKQTQAEFKDVINKGITAEDYLDSVNKYNLLFLETFSKLASTKINNTQERLDIGKEALALYGFKDPKNLAEGDLLVITNPFIELDADLQNKLITATKNYMLHNQADTKLDAPENGQAAKNYRQHKMNVPDDQLYKLFTMSTFSMEDSVLKDLSSLISNNALSKTKLSNYINSLNFNNMLTKEGFDFANAFLDEMFNSGSMSSEAKARHLLYLAQILQQNTQQSKGYNEALHTVVPKLIQDNTKEDYDKYKILYDYMKSEGYEVGDLASKDTDAITLLTLSTNIIHTFMDDKQAKTYINYASSDDPTLYNIYSSAVFKNKMLGQSPRFDSDIISSEEVVNLNIAGRTAHGLGKARIAVDISEDSDTSDTMSLTKSGKNKLGYSELYNINTNSLSAKKQEALKEFILKNKSKTISGIDLSNFLNVDKADGYKYQIIGIVDRFNRKVSVTKDTNLADCTLLLNSQTSLYSMAKETNVKLGILGSKAGKGTVINTEDSVGDADIILGSHLFNTEKLSNAVPVGAPIIMDNGKRYQLYDVNNLALLNNLNFKAQNTLKDKYIDTIGIVQGGHGLGSLMAFSQLYIRQLEDGSWEYDPTAYNKLRNELGYNSLERRYQQTNGASELRALRLIYMLESVSDENKKQELINSLSFGKCKTEDELINLSLNSMDLGGVHGARLESWLWRQLSTDEQSKLDATISNKNNSFGRLAFSNEAQSSLVNPYASFFNYTNSEEQRIISKHAKPTDSSVRVSDLQAGSDNDWMIANLENSALDLNDGNFVSKEAMLRLLLSYAGRNYIPGTVQEAYNNDILSPVIGYLGNLYNGYKFIDGAQARVFNGNFEEIQSAKKAGNKLSYSSYLENKESYNLFPTISPSSNINEDYYDASNDIYSRMKKDYLTTGSGIVNQLRYSLPFFGDGSDVSIKESKDLFTSGYGQPLHTRVPTINDSDNDVRFKTRVALPEYETDNNGNFITQNGIRKVKLYDYNQMEDFIKKNTKDPQAALLINKKNQLFYEDFKNINPEDALKILNERTKLKQQNDSEIKKYLAEWNSLKKEYEEYESLTPTDNINSLFKVSNSYDNSNVLKVAARYSDSNGIKLLNSLLNSYGYKASSNGEIALGNRTLNFQNNVGASKEQLLGTEYGFLLNMSNHSPELYQELNKYMEAEAALEGYYELTTNKEKYIKHFGKVKYNENVQAAYEALGEDPQSIRDLQVKILKENAGLNVLVEAAAKINRRLVLEISKDDPFGLVGWLLNSDTNSTNKQSWFKYHNIKLQKLYKSNFIESISAVGKTLQQMSDSEAASLFFNKESGYIGMVEELSNRIAISKASDNLGTYLRRTGWIENATATDVAMDLFQTYATKFYESEQSTIESEEQRALNKKTFDTWSYILYDANANTSGFDISNYKNISSLYSLFLCASENYNTLLKQYNVSSMQELRDSVYKAMSSADGYQKTVGQSHQKIINAYENIFSETLRTMMSTGDSKELFSEINKNLLKLETQGKVLVDKDGRHLNKGQETLDYSSNHFYLDLMTMLKKPDNPDELSLYIAKEALLGNVYLADESLAKQLERKVYSRRVHSRTKQLMKKAKNLTTTFIMSSPVQLLDRLINFPLFDSGVTMSADIGTAKYMTDATSTIMKYVSSGEHLSDEDIKADHNMKALMRFLLVSNQELLNNETFRGENMKIDIPFIRKYADLTAAGFNIGNMIPRFAYFLNLENSAIDNPNGLVYNRNKSGVTWDKYDEINKMEAEDRVISSDLFKEFGDNAKDYADLDTRLAYIVAQHNGMEGNMPYSANWLNENFNTMFLSFPLALLRWGKNRVTSIGNAISDAATGNQNKGLQYLGGQLGSAILTQALLLGLQLLLSQDSREYIEKKLKGKDDELTDEEIKNAENIIFRGGVVKPFNSLMQGEEITSTGQNRGPVAGLFDSYVADWTNKFGSDEDFATKLKNFILSHTWSHANFIPKDIIESIPGNNVLQSTSWYTPSNNWWDNYSRKVLGYTMGSTQANAFMDYMQTNHSNDDGFTKDSKKLYNAMNYAFVSKYSNTKETKSEARNYKKAIQLVYDYYNTVYGNSSSAVNTVSDPDSLTSKIKNLMKTSSSSADVYYLIQSAINSGTSYSDIQKSLRSATLREKVLTLPDYKKFIDSLEETEYTTLKTALAYEDHNYPYLADLLDEINSEATKEYYQSNAYTKNISSILNQMSYNSRVYKYNSYNSNYSNYRKSNRFFNQVNNYNKYDKRTTPMDAYNNMIDTKDYGVSTDIWGNKTQHYKDGKSYTSKQRGFNPFNEED